MEQPILPVTYCLDNWLLEWKTKVVKAWVDHTPHFGHIVTSRIEGSHAKLKSYLGTSTADLKGVYDKIVLYWTAQHSDYITNLALSRTRTPHQFQTPIFSALIGKIHPYALHKVSDQLNKLAHPLPLCSGTYRAVNGLPCAHELLHIRTNNTYIPFNAIHGHWHFYRALTAANIDPPPIIPVLDPLPVHPRGRPERALNRKGRGSIAVERGPREVEGRGARGGLEHRGEEEEYMGVKIEHKEEEVEDKGEKEEYREKGEECSEEEPAQEQVYEVHDKILRHLKELIFSYLLQLPSIKKNQ